MKKFMCLMLALSIVMMTMVFVPMSASAASSFYVFDDFDDSTTIDTNKWTNVRYPNQEAGSLIVDGTVANRAGSNVLRIGNREYDRFGTNFGSAITKGYVNIKYDIYVPTDWTKEVKLNIFNKTDNNTNDRTLLYLQSGGSLNFSSLANGASNAITTLTLGAWNTIDLRVNVETGEVAINVTKGNGDPVSKTGTYSSANILNVLKSVESIFFQEMSIGQYAYIDNLLIQHDNYELPISDDFNGGSFNSFKWNNSLTNYVSLEERAAGDNAVKVFGQYWPKNLSVKLDEPITEDAVNIKFDVKMPETKGREINVCGGDATEYENSRILGINANGELTLKGVSGKSINLTLGKWYAVDLLYNVKTKEVAVSAIPCEGGESKTISGISTATGIGNDKVFSFGTKFGSDDATTYALLDNVSISKQEVVEVKRELPVTDDFGGDAIDTEKWDEITGTTTGETPQVSLNNSALKIYNIYADAGIGTTITEPITDGKINVKYEVWFDKEFIERTIENRAELLLYGGKGFTTGDAIVWMCKDGFNISGAGSSICTPVAETWYTVDVTVDVATRQTTLIVTPENGKTITQTATCSSAAIASTSQIGFGGRNLNYEPKSYALVDNVSITQPVNAPKSEGVTFVKYDDTTSTALTNVSAGTKEIVVGFSADVDDSTLNDDTVTLVNKTTNTTVDYTGEYNATAKTWTIPLGTAYLDPSATYELTVTSAVQNGDGESAPLYRYAFTTDAGEYKVTSITAYKGDTVVDKWADLEDGDTITVKANVINTTGTDKTLLLICAGYNGDEVKACAVSNTKAVTKDQKNITVEDITLTVDKDDMKMVKLFGWDNTLDYLTTGVNVID